ncbi:aryl-sulfate sulfotransferase [Opitutia bacterium ISCC 51]|nr:aryl-sulfate sulfotransferase [Opitutae bacterium ISCC 51]QXD27372.1 aryl-sulfate sulfotransferase [Opitutae bacterium ISCC 52]
MLPVFSSPAAGHNAAISISLMALLFISCSSSSPTIQHLEVDLDPSDTVPLSAEVSFNTSQATTVALEFVEGDRSWIVDTNLPVDTKHVVPILGMRAGRTHKVTVVVSNSAGQTERSEPIEIKTDPLPEDFPPIEIKVSQPDKMEPGFTFIEPTYVPVDDSKRPNDWIIALDEDGEVVWYYKTPPGVADTQRLENGNLIFTAKNVGIFEIDMLGNIISHWYSNLAKEDQIYEDSIHVDTDTLHHEFAVRKSGNILAISTEVRKYDNYPTSETDPDAPKATDNVIGDVIVEFDRGGNIVREIKLLDIIDPYRIGYGSLNGRYWQGLYGHVGGTPRDWSHANSVSLDEEERFALFSMRYQNAVLKLDLETNEIVWIMGDHTGWGPDWQPLLLKPKGELTWHADQHAPMNTPEGTILLFDNGMNRALPFNPKLPVSESRSRAVEYRIDEENREVEEIWSYGDKPGDERYYAWRVGDADWMPQTGNVLINFGGLTYDKNDNFGNGVNRFNWIRIVEVTRTTPAEKVFELKISDKRPAGWLSFQAERLPSLYP